MQAGCLFSSALDFSLLLVKVNAQAKKKRCAFSLTKTCCAFSLTKNDLSLLTYYDNFFREDLPAGRCAFSLTKGRSYHVTLNPKRPDKIGTWLERGTQFSGNRRPAGKSEVNHSPRSKETSCGESETGVSSYTESLY